MDRQEQFLRAYEQLLRTHGMMFDPDHLRTGVGVVDCTARQAEFEMRRLRTGRDQPKETTVPGTPGKTEDTPTAQRSRVKANKASDPEAPAE